MTPSALRREQEWMYAVITHPGTDDEAWMSSPAQRHLTYAEAQTLVLPSATLSGQERMAIYRHMYFLRMREALEIDFPVVKAVAGVTLFDHLVEDYAAAHPSTSYTLDHFGREFPGFISSFQGVYGTLLHAVALAEQAITQSEQAKDSMPFVPSGPDLADPGRVRLSLRPSVKRLLLDYPVHELLNAYYNDVELPEEPGRAETALVVYRDREFAVHWHVLTDMEDRLLAALTSGETLERAVEVWSEGEATVSVPDPEFVRSSLASWMQLELFAQEKEIV
jgi:hypothetical protein